jgi:hypothetical protein
MANVLNPTARKHGLYSADGAAAIIHDRADDEVTDQSGNSGDSVACTMLGSLPSSLLRPGVGDPGTTEASASLSDDGSPLERTQRPGGLQHRRGGLRDRSCLIDWDGDDRGDAPTPAPLEPLHCTPVAGNPERRASRVAWRSTLRGDWRDTLLPRLAHPHPVSPCHAASGGSRSMLRRTSGSRSA